MKPREFVDRYRKDPRFIVTVPLLVLAATSLIYYAIQKAKELCYRHMQYPRNLALVWASEVLREQKEAMGADPYPYGLELNHKALEAVVRYEHEQGMIKKRPAVEELFFPPSLQEIQHYL